MSKIPLFKRLEIETSSLCNRRCTTCIRNSIPDKESTSSWFSMNELDKALIVRIFEQSQMIGFNGEICLSHYNEPLLDHRIVDISQKARSFGFSRVFMCSNGDHLTEELASHLDGVVHDIGFTIYTSGQHKQERIAWIKSLFKQTKIVIGAEQHMITHHSPLCDVNVIAQKHRNNPCRHPLTRFVVNHKGEMLLCCDDLTGHFSLGNIADKSISELWYSDAHQNLVNSLQNSGGRMLHDWCKACPRP